jgi:sulfite exporter TauE/SafE/copper chaperone CopZ
MASITKGVRITGMHCANCEKRVTDTLTAAAGVTAVSIDWKAGRGTVTFDDRKARPRELIDKLDSIGYSATFGEEEPKDAGSSGRRAFPKTAGVVFAALGLVVIVYLILKVSSSVTLPDITSTMGLGLLFVVGLLTGFHCVGMCGGFVVGYTTKAAARGESQALSHLQYGAGKLLSYTAMGAAFGLLGSFVTFTPLARGVVGILAGIFLLVYGLSMLGVFSWTKRIRIASPAFLDRFVDRESKRSRSPLVIGLLNGLMIACGPLQAIYVMAAGTGSVIEGAKSLFVFGAGTLPVMLGFGLVTGVVSGRATKKILFASGTIVMILGVIMINRGLALSGTGLDASSLVASGIASEDKGTGIEMKDGYQIIRMDVTRYGWEPDRFVLKKGVPVRWIITGKEINSCNNAIVVPELGLNFPVKSGEQVIEFTPTKEGPISWSCWMGMIPGAFVVKDAKDISEGGATDPGLESLPALRSGTCRMGGGIGGGSCCGGGIRQ